MSNDNEPRQLITCPKCLCIYFYGNGTLPDPCPRCGVKASPNATTTTGLRIHTLAESEQMEYPHEPEREKLSNGIEIISAEETKKLMCGDNEEPEDNSMTKKTTTGFPVHPLGDEPETKYSPVGDPQCEITPPIPTNCDRFIKGHLGDWKFKLAGKRGDVEVELILKLKDPLDVADLCNAAIVAFMDAIDDCKTSGEECQKDEDALIFWRELKRKGGKE